MSKVEAIKELLDKCNDVEVINKELKRLASMKSRLKKQRGRKGTMEQLQEVEACEALLREAKVCIGVATRKYTELTQDDVDTMGLDEVARAIKAVQSKKSNSKWLTDVEGDNDEYRNAVRIEEMLKGRRSELQPARSSRLAHVVRQAKLDEDMSKEDLIGLLEELL